MAKLSCAIYIIVKLINNLNCKGAKDMIYPAKISSFLKKHPVYVPYKICKPNERLKYYRRYWFEDRQEIIKVLEIYEIDGIEYYFIKIGTSLYGSIPYPVKEATYELVPDTKDLFSRDNIIGDNNYYSGAEIKFWFFLHKDVLKKYSRDIVSFIDTNSKNVLNENIYYRVEYYNDTIRIINKKNTPEA